MNDITRKCENSLTQPTKNDFLSLFSTLPPIDPFDDKKETIGIDLLALILNSGHTRTFLCETLNWKPSRVSKILSGDNNLTIKTIWEVANAVGFDFDIIYRHKKKQRSTQAWETFPLEITICAGIQVQTAEQVMRDVAIGNVSPIYLSPIVRNSEILNYETIEVAKWQKV